MTNENITYMGGLSIGQAFNDNQSPAAEPQYHVVMQDPSSGVTTSTSFESQTAFDTWYTGSTQDETNTLYAQSFTIVEQGITEDRATELVALAFVTAMQSEQAIRPDAHYGVVEPLFAQHEMTPPPGYTP